MFPFPYRVVDPRIPRKD